MRLAGVREEGQIETNERLERKAKTEKKRQLGERRKCKKVEGYEKTMEQKTGEEKKKFLMTSVMLINNVFERLNAQRVFC